MNLRKALCNLSLILCCAMFCAAQVPVSLAPVAQQQFLDANGNPLAFGCVYTYQSGTTTALATYSDYTGLRPNPDPVVLSASGAANIWLQSGQLYTIQVISAGGDATCSLGTTMYTVDGVGGGTSTTSTSVATSTTPLFNVIASIQLFNLTITGNTVALPVTFTNVQAPAVITFQITQDGVGGHTFTWPTNVTGGGAIDTTANHTTTQSFVWNGSTILPIGNAFTSVGNTALIGTIYSTNTFSGPQTFTGGITVTGGAVIDSVTTPTVSASGNGTSLSLSAAAGSSGNTAGGNYSVSAGAGIGSGNGGAVTIASGSAPGAGNGGNITFTPGTGTANGSVVLNGNTKAKRIFFNLGTTLVSGDFATSGWGSGGGTVTPSGTDAAGTAIVTGGSTASANPTVTLTFHDGTWGTTPFCVVSNFNSGARSGDIWSISSLNGTSMQVTLGSPATPTNLTAYEFSWFCN